MFWLGLVYSCLARFGHLKFYFGWALFLFLFFFVFFNLAFLYMYILVIGNINIRILLRAHINFHFWKKFSRELKK